MLDNISPVRTASITTSPIQPSPVQTSPVETGVGIPIELLSSTPFVHRLVSGSVDIFIYRNVRHRRHIARIVAPAALFGTSLRGEPAFTHQLIAVPAPDACFGDIEAVDSDERVRLLEQWARSVIEPLLAASADAQPPTQDTAPLGDATGPRPGAVPALHPAPRWLRLTSGTCRLAGVEISAAKGQPRLIFVPPSHSVGMAPHAEVEALETAALMQRHDPDRVAFALLELVERLADEQFGAERLAFARRRAERGSLDAREIQLAVAHLAVLAGSGFDDDTAEDTANPVVSACTLVLRHTGVELPPGFAVGTHERNVIARVARAARARLRRVALQSGWHRGDNGALLGFAIDDGRPLALLPKGPRTYRMVDPRDGSRRDVDDRLAAAVAPFGYTFYRPFPAEALTVRHLFKFASRGLMRDWITVVVTGAVSGLVALTTPIFSQIIFDHAIPEAERTTLIEIIAGLLAAAVGSALFSVTSNIAMLRMETRMESSIDLALWDRLIDLPAAFHRRYSVGDLAQRASGINAIRRLLSTAALSSMLGSVFSLFNLALLFSYSSVLSFTAIALISIELMLIAGSTYASVFFLRRTQVQQGHVLSLLTQLLSGITKLRTAAVEVRAFRRWADVFSRLRRTIWHSDMVSAGLSTVNSFFSVASTMAIFAMVAVQVTHNKKFGVGEFIGFNVAYGQLSGSTLSLGGVLMRLINIVPLYERARPILTALPETAAGKTDPGVLIGDVAVSGLCFGYAADGPPLIKNLSFSIKAGEFVAIVGPSGSGKSTLLRLLLGLEQPSSGSLFYDGQDLAELDVREVRQQIGVVLQTSQVLPGSILENIVGTSGLDQDQAWEAARMAALDEDIARMPMGMATLVMENGGGFSGGQQQRLQIARAVARRPRLLFLDEATSALDNTTQAVVSELLATLQATRIVVAHRLSTIKTADRILVMERGSIVEEGTFATLVARDGVFARLAAGQLV